MATNVTFKNNPLPWRSSIGSLYESDIIGWLLQNPDLYETINDMQRKHYNIYTRNTDNGDLRSNIEDDDLVGAYQQDIINNFNTVNTKGIQAGNTIGRYNISAKPNSGDNAKHNWRADKKYGAETDDRRVLGRKGDYNLSDLEELAERLEPAGLTIYLDPTTNYYMVKPISDNSAGNSGGSSDGSSTTLTLTTNNSGIPDTLKNWLNLYPKPKSNYPGWSDWIPLTAKKIVDDIAAIRTGNLERQKRFPLFEAPYEQAKVTDAYAQRLLLEKQKQEVLARAGYSPTSDLTQNLNARVKGEQIAEEISDKQTALKSKEFADTTKLVQDTANKNNMYRTNVANLNILSNVAAMNSIIDSRIKQNERLASNLGTYIGDMYTNYGEYLKTKRLNENAHKRYSALSDYNLGRADAYKAYYNLLENPASWNKIKEFVQEFDAEGAPGLTGDLIRIWNYRDFKNPEYKNLIIDLLKNSQSVAGKKYRALYQQDLNSLEKLGLYYDSIAQSKLNAILSSIDTYATNLWGWNLGSKVRKSVLSQKSGGKVVDTFSRLERIRQRELQSVRDNTMKRHRLASDNLNKQLDRISREELALLRAIFK